LFYVLHKTNAEGTGENMEAIRRFLREKAFVLLLAVCVLAAAGMGLWAVTLVRDRLQEDLQGQTQSETNESDAQDAQLGLETGEGEDAVWQQENTEAAGAASSVPQPSNAPSGASSGSGLVHEPSELRTESEPADAAAASSYAQPVVGKILAAYSGDDLVYNQTLGDWRTHNGIDYSCNEGDSVFAPTSGTVEQIRTDGNWGAVIELRDSKNRLWRLCGVGEAAVKQGEEVVTGQALGQACDIGCETALGAHVHMELLDEDEHYLDPAQVMG
jgi:murein DD-endopeptidase MepM/ murein hydrolase activator NlpD